MKAMTVIDKIVPIMTIQTNLLKRTLKNLIHKITQMSKGSMKKVNNRWMMINYTKDTWRDANNIKMMIKIKFIRYDYLLIDISSNLLFLYSFLTFIEILQLYLLLLVVIFLIQEVDLEYHLFFFIYYLLFFYHLLKLSYKLTA